MKTKISIGDFIKEVKHELVQAQSGEDEMPFYKLQEVELEVSFALEAIAKGGANLFVIDVGGEKKGSQNHKVNLKLKTLVNTKKESEIKTSDSGGGGGGSGRGPVYAP